MERESLGLIETSGLVAAIEAADAGSKAANVTFRGYARARAGLITVVFLGDVAAVRAAVTAGAVAAKRVGTVISMHVIARPDRQLHVIANGAKPLDKLLSVPTVERIAPEPKQAGVAALAEVADIEEGGAAPSAACEIAEVPQPEPALQVAEIREEPAVEEHSREEKVEAETSMADLSDDDHLVVEEEPEEEVAVAAHVSTPHKKEKVRKPRSKRKA